MTKKRSIEQIKGAVALTKARRRIGKQSGENDRAVMRNAYNKDQLPQLLRDEIEELARNRR